MARTPSHMTPLGTKMPSFTLPEPATGRLWSSEVLATTPARLVMFLCNHCPFVIHVRDEVGRVAHDAMARGVGVVAINANSVITHPQDGPEHMAQLVRDLGWHFPFLFDETQAVARAFGAACTPDFFLFDGTGSLAYRGQLDDSRPGNSAPVTGGDLRAAIDAVLAGRAPTGVQLPSLGCNIKWHPTDTERA